MYQKVLLNAGLNEKQAKVYMACLELGGAKVPDIARDAEIKRTTAYGVLDELLSLGFVSLVKKGRTQIYTAQDPAVILDWMNSNYRSVENIIPDLRNIFTTYHLRPRIEFFQGKEGIKRIYEDTLRCRSKKILQIVRVKDFLAFPGGNFGEEYIKKRTARGITAYALNPASGDFHTELFGEESQQWKRHTRYLPPNIFYAAMIMIYDDKVAMVSTKKENFGFIIESREFSGTLRAYFDFMWKLGSKQPEE